MIQTNPRNFIFEKVKMTAPERNGFDLAHENKQTCKSGYIYPFELIEALPNDDFQIQTESFIRLQPMLSPTMHRLNAYWHWFFCPNRLTWNYWEEFISRGNGKKLPQNQEYTPPEPVTISLYDMLFCMSNLPYTSDGYIKSRLLDYLASVGTSETEFWKMEIDEQHNVLRETFKEFEIVRVRDRTSHSAFMCISRTPRVATSMGVVDTCIPRGVIRLDNSDDEISSDKYNGVDSFDFNITNLYLMFSEEHYNTGKKVFNFYSTTASADIENYVQRLLNTRLSVMPFVAYTLIYNDYYRDENLIEEYDEVIDFFKNETGQLETSIPSVREHLSKLLKVYYRAWEKDYFTTATQMPQKAPDVLIPGTGSGDAQIVGDGNLWFTATDGDPLPSQLGVISTAEFAKDGNHAFLQAHSIGNNSQVSSAVGYESGLKIQSSNGATGTTVADVRRSFALQRWFEKAVRTGTRYIESLKAFFNSDAGDARLQRPEYIGGTSTPVQISDVVQNSATADGSDTPQGNLAGYGIASDNSEMLSYHAPEHGFVIGCFSILARTSYSQGIPNAFSRETWLDYAWPEFEHIGEQGIKEKELYAMPLTKDILSGANISAVDANSSKIFGYQSRYADYKQIPDRFGGAFARSLDFWSLGRMFATPPSLSKDFVEAHISDRNFALTRTDSETDTPFENDVEDVDSDQYICDFWIDCKKVTSLTLFSEPI